MHPKQVIDVETKKQTVTIEEEEEMDEDEIEELNRLRKARAREMQATTQASENEIKEAQKSIFKK